MVTAAQKRATQKYNSSHYSQITVKLEKSLVDDFKTVLAANNESLAGWIRDRMTEYINQNKQP